MSAGLQVTLGQHSQAGRKPVNQDFHGAMVPHGPLLASKGIALALADGISSSAVSQIASAAAVRSFLDDYYCTSEAWSVRRAAQRVLEAGNSWLHAQTQRSPARFDRDRGHVCTFSALILKGREAHLLHVGDTRVYRLHAQALEQLTKDHRVQVSSVESYLGRALGAGPSVEIDYRCWDTEPGEVYLLATDGVWEHVDATAVQAVLARRFGVADQQRGGLVGQADVAAAVDQQHAGAPVVAAVLHRKKAFGHGEVKPGGEQHSANHHGHGGGQRQGHHPRPQGDLQDRIRNPAEHRG